MPQKIKKIPRSWMCAPYQSLGVGARDWSWYATQNNNSNNNNNNNNNDNNNNNNNNNNKNEKNYSKEKIKTVYKK